MTDRQLRILMIAPTPFFADRGCHVRIFEEIRALQAQGHDVHLVTYGLGRDVPGVSISRGYVFPWYRKLSAGPSWQKPFLDLFLLVRALREARRFRPHVIHAHLHEGAFLGIFLKYILRIPLVFDCQGSLTTEIVDHGFVQEDSLLWRLFAMMERWINGAADFIVTSSSPGKDDLLDRWDISPIKVAAVVDGVDTDVFMPRPAIAPRREFGIPEDVPLVVYLGVLNDYQGTDILLQAAKALLGEGAKVHFLVMGYPEEKYRREVESLGLADMVTLPGRIDYARAPEYLCAGDIAVSPKISRTEANGKLLNYMACGLPTVVFDTPVNREILGEAGVYADYADVADFTAKIAALLESDTERERLGKAARERAEREHSWSARAETLSAVFNRILSKAAAGTRA